MAIAFDTSTTSLSPSFAAGATYTFSHACTGSNLFLALMVALWQDVAGTGSVSSASYNGVALTGAVASALAGMRAEIWYLKAPAAGTHTVSIPIAGNTDSRKFAVASFTGVDQTTQPDATNHNETGS